MPAYQVAYNATTKVATIQADGAVAPGGSTIVANGDFNHFDDANDQLDNHVSHVLYHHVRDALYKIGVLDMQSVNIQSQIIFAQGMRATQHSIEVEVEATSQITLEWNPTTATVKTVTYVSSDTDIATVSAGGLVTGVAEGEAVITVTSTDGGFTDTVKVTVVAAEEP